MAIEYFQCARHYHVSIVGPTMAGPIEIWAQRKKFTIKALIMAQNAILRSVFANILFNKKAILLIF